mmetsp:Transcript_138328/g.240517  ORF Transcript_138328/g.240517 Transcript_138328/m.240517 type:complete len:90 (+) Transcript_138328:6277-6546(+)
MSVPIGSVCVPPPVLVGLINFAHLSGRKLNHSSTPLLDSPGASEHFQFTKGQPCISNVAVTFSGNDLCVTPSCIHHRNNSQSAVCRVSV